MEKLIKKTFYPAFIILGFAILATLQWLLSAKVSLNILTTIAVFAMVAAVIIFEMKMPYRKDWNKSKNDLLSDFFLTMIIFPVVINVCRWLVEIYPTAWKLADLTKWSLPIQVLFGVLVAEFLFYWIHRISHENKKLWKLHERHHAVKRVYWMNSGSLNPIDMFLNFLGYGLPFAIFKMDAAALEYALFFTAITGLLEHANVNFKAGALNYVFNTAELHRWHHSVVLRESKKNYGKALSIYDVAFGTYYNPPRRQVEKVGVN